MTSAAEDAQAAFSKYDRNRSGGITVEELRALLKDMGLLEGMAPQEAASWVVAQFAMADRKSKDGRLDLREFTSYYQKVSAPRLLEALTADMPAEVAALRHVFAAFAAFGAGRGQRAGEMDGACFMKLCKETGLVGPALSATAADLAFASVKNRRTRRITFDQFLDALDLAAAKSGRQLGDVVRLVAASGGPRLSAASEAGPLQCPEAHARHSSAASASSRSAASVSQSSCSTARSVSHRSAAGRSRSAASAGASAASQASVGQSLGAQDVQSRDGLRETFLAFASFGLGSVPWGPSGKARSAEMDCTQFAKLCREAGLLGGALTATAADLAFVSKAQQRGSRKLGFRQFLAALEQLAQEKGVPAEELCAQVAGCVGPRLNGTSSGIEPQLLTSRRRSSPHATHSRPPLAAVQAAGSAAAQGRGKSSGCGPAPHEEAAAAVAAAVYKLSIGSGAVNIRAVAQ